MVEAAIVFKLLPVSILDIHTVFEYIDMLFIAYGNSLSQLYLPYLAQILVFRVTCGVEVMSLHHG